MPRGRKPVIADDTKRGLFLEALKAGSFVDTACGYAGISETAVYSALAKAELPGAAKVYTEFAAAVKEARDRSELRALTIIQNDPSWQSKAWFLERTRPDKYGRRTRLEHTGNAEAAPVQVAVRDEHAAAVSLAMRNALAALPLTPPDGTG